MPERIVIPSEEKLRRYDAAADRILGLGPNPLPPLDLPADRYDVVPIVNQAGVAIPDEGCVLKLAGMESDGVHYTAERPPYPGLSLIGISTSPVPIGGQGRAYTRGGQCKVRMNTTDWASVLPGDRIGPATDSFDARRDDLGAIKVIEKLASPYVRAEITGERGDHIVIDAAAVDAAASGVYQHVRFSGNYSLSQDEIGLTDVV